jgi:glycosyltransferase involved in cell wall biosynthesis
MPPRVSIITPCYNDGRYLADAVGSVEKCDATLYELIIVDDGSTDPHTQSVLGDLERRGYRVVRQCNQGLGAARNAGISRAAGDYILPLDADNKIRPEYLTLALEILEADPSAGVVYGYAELFGEKSGVWAPPEFDAAAMWHANFIDACAVFRKKVWEDAGGYETALAVPGWEDWDFWLSAAGRGWGFRRLERVVFDYRVRGDSMIARYRSKHVPAEVTDYIARKHSAFLKRTFDGLYSKHWERQLKGGRWRNLVGRLTPTFLRKLAARV